MSQECPGCGAYLLRCVDCLLLLCGVVGCAVFEDSTFLFAQSHSVCTECHLLRCNGSVPCRCTLPFYWVTPTVAIGNSHAGGDPFHVIVDVNYPANGCALGEIREDRNGISAGLPTGDDNLTRACLAKIVTVVNQSLRAKDARHRILFRSERGQTRSVLLCLYYLFRSVWRCSPANVLSLIHEQATRPVVITPFLGEMFGVDQGCL